MGPRYAALPSTIPVEPFSPPFHLSFHRLFFQCLPFVEEFLSLCQSQFHLDPSVGEVKPKGNERKSPFLNLPDEALNLPLVEEEFSAPQGGLIKSIPEAVRIDMRIDQVDLPFSDIAVAIAEIG